MTVRVFLDTSRDGPNGYPMVLETSTEEFTRFVVACAQAVKPQVEILRSLCRAQKGHFLIGSPESDQAAELSKIVRAIIPWLVEATANWYTEPKTAYFVEDEEVRLLIEISSAYDEILTLLHGPINTTSMERLVKFLERREARRQEREAANTREPEVSTQS